MPGKTWYVMNENHNENETYRIMSCVNVGPWNKDSKRRFFELSKEHVALATTFIISHVLTTIWDRTSSGTPLPRLLHLHHRHLKHAAKNPYLSILHRKKATHGLSIFQWPRMLISTVSIQTYVTDCRRYRQRGDQRKTWDKCGPEHTDNPRKC